MAPTPERVGGADARAPSLVIRPAAPADAAALARALRPADRRELAALGRAPEPALAECLAESREAYAVAFAESGALVCLFGVAPHPYGPSIGAPWLMASPAIERVRRPFLRQSRGWVDWLGRGFTLLTNAVDERNTLHVRWLRWCGFTFVTRFKAGPEGAPFLEFVRLAPADPSSQDHQGETDMCGFSTAIAAASLASSAVGAVQGEQNRRAANAAARREQAILRRQTLQRYEELAAERQASQERAAEKIEASRREAARLAGRADAREGRAGRSGAALRRDILGLAASEQQAARRADERRRHGLSLAEEGVQLGVAKKLLEVNERAPDYGRQLAGLAVGLEQTRDLRDAVKKDLAR